MMTSVSKPVMLDSSEFRFLFAVSDTLPNFENWSDLFLTLGLDPRHPHVAVACVFDMPKPAANILTYSFAAPGT